MKDQSKLSLVCFSKESGNEVAADFGEKVPSTILGSREVFYSTRVSNRARRLSLRVSRKGLEVVLPRPGWERHALPFIRKNALWVLKHLEKVERLVESEDRDLLPAGCILLQGRTVRVEGSRGMAADPFVSLDRDQRLVQVSLSQSSDGGTASILEAWLRDFAEKEIRRRVEARASEMRLRPSRVTLRNQRTRWGSCSHKGNIALNWQLIMAPPEVLDYVVVHELAHLAVLSHGKRFWRLVEKHCPAHREHRRWLRQNEALVRRPYEALTASLFNQP